MKEAVIVLQTEAANVNVPFFLNRNRLAVHPNNVTKDIIAGTLPTMRMTSSLY